MALLHQYGKREMSHTNGLTAGACLCPVLTGSFLLSGDGHYGVVLATGTAPFASAMGVI
jgi:hypothetical protein